MSSHNSCNDPSATHFPLSPSFITTAFMIGGIMKTKIQQEENRRYRGRILKRRRATGKTRRLKAIDKAPLTDKQAAISLGAKSIPPRLGTEYANSAKPASKDIALRVRTVTDGC